MGTLQSRLAVAAILCICVQHGCYQPLTPSSVPPSRSPCPPLVCCCIAIASRALPSIWIPIRLPPSPPLTSNGTALYPSCLSYFRLIAIDSGSLVSRPPCLGFPSSPRLVNSSPYVITPPPVTIRVLLDLSERFPLVSFGLVPRIDMYLLFALGLSGLCLLCLKRLYHTVLCVFSVS
ncbi:uncharacterized protein B0H18DRAFT_422147 [Fomitopsis serialis]|uniref:uncharacterized protein n=1 Tax=Fomitopsis serialis TaxID=139415 RepID=UPI002007D552|nr:uncharacterized protein B0H18DRAFT_422147 [Neoantrodia serialis]KAH9935749.1 hypothetical protein B0H18DRAFT_422147 [Neoantrodia serialis]